MIIDIRGTHGSGKSYLVHNLLTKYGGWERTITEPKLGVIGHYLEAVDCGIVARYTESGGGCDGVKTQAEVVRRVRNFDKEFSHVILEGILVGHTYQRYADLADEIGRDKYIFAFLPTPREECIRRVEERRLRRRAKAKSKPKGAPKPLNTYHLDNDYERCHKHLPAKFAAAGYQTLTLDWRDPVPQIVRILEDGT